MYTHTLIWESLQELFEISVYRYMAAERFKSFLWLKKIETHYTMEAVLIISSTCEG